MKKILIASLSLLAVVALGIVYVELDSSENVPPETTTARVAPEPPTPPRITTEEREYFKAVVLGSEYGDNSHNIRKWTKENVTVGLNGNINSTDKECTDNTIADFNRISTEVKLTLSETSNADIQIHFAPEPEFKSILSSYVAVNRGYFSSRWSDNVIMESTILIDSTNAITQTQRCHLIREELTQSMGMMQDSNLYADSIFQIEWTETVKYSKQDESVIRLLYGGNGIEPGDSAEAIDSKTIVTDMKKDR